MHRENDAKETIRSAESYGEVDHLLKQGALPQHPLHRFQAVQAKMSKPVLAPYTDRMTPKYI